MNRFVSTVIIVLFSFSLMGYVDVGIKITNNPVMMNYNQFDVVWFSSFGFDKNKGSSTFFLDGDVNLYTIYKDVSYGKFSCGIDVNKLYRRDDKLRFIAKLKGETDIYFDEYRYYGGYSNCFNINYFGDFMVKEGLIMDITQYPEISVSMYSEKYFFPYLWISFFWDSSSVYWRNGVRFGYYNNGGNLMLFSSMVGYSKGIRENSGMFVRFYVDRYIKQGYSVTGVSGDMDDYFLSLMFYEGYMVKGGYTLNTEEYDLQVSLELYKRRYSPVIYTDFSSIREDVGGILTIDYLINGYTNDMGISFSIKDNVSEIKPYRSFTLKLFLGL